MNIHVPTLIVLILFAGLLVVGTVFPAERTGAEVISSEQPEGLGGEILEFNPFRPDMELFQGRMEIDDESFDLTALRLFPGRYSFHVAAPAAEKQLGSSLGYSLFTYLQKSGGDAVLSGGYLASFFPPLPLGLVKLEDKLVNRPRMTRYLSGVLCFNAERIVIERYKSIESISSWPDCLQSGPLLILDGQKAFTDDDVADEITDEAAARHFLSGKYSRSFVAVDCANRTILGITGKASLPALVTLLLREIDRGGLGCKDGINLGGADIAGLLGLGDQYFLQVGNVDIRLPNAIIVKQRMPE